MSSAETIAERLREQMQCQSIGENELARRAQVPQPTIHRILVGESKSPRISNLEKIGKALGTTASYLAYGNPNSTASPPSLGTGISIGAGAAAHGGWGRLGNNPFKASDVSRDTQTSRLALGYGYPVIEWKEIQSTEAIKAAVASVSSESMELCGYDAVGIGFWLKIDGDSMSAPVGCVPSLTPGTLVLFDTSFPATLGKLVLSKALPTSKPVIRRFIEDGGNRYLQALNPSYPLTQLDKSSQILATAIESKSRL